MDQSPIDTSPSPSVTPPKTKTFPWRSIIVGVVCLAVAGGGVYFWQQPNITNLQKQTQSLTASLYTANTTLTEIKGNLATVEQRYCVDYVRGAWKNNLCTNPFQALYDFFPAGSKIQSCIKSDLGANFITAYTDGILPSSTPGTVQTCLFGAASQSGTIPAQQYFNNLPSAVQQCVRSAFGSDFNTALSSNSFQPTAQEQNQLLSCHAFTDMQNALTAFGQYAQQKFGETAVAQSATTGTPPIQLVVQSVQGMKVSINGNANPLAQSTVTRLSWNWGDGTPAQTGWFPETHTYAKAGVYTVTVTATYSNNTTTSDHLVAHVL